MHIERFGFVFYIQRFKNLEKILYFSSISASEYEYIYFLARASTHQTLDLML